MTADLHQMKILMVDDEEANLVILRNILGRAGYRRVRALQDPRATLDTYLSFEPDLLIVDYHMPHLDGLGVIKQLLPHLPEYFPILMLTADERAEIRELALASGARDFLTKPLSGPEVKLRIRNLLEARHFHKQLERHNEQLEEKVRARTAQLERTQIEMLIRLAKASEYRDDESGEHVWRVARAAALVGRELGLPDDLVELLLRAARLHDVGKIAIPDGILLKPSRLTPEEFEVVKSHTTVGAQLLSGGQSRLMRMAESIALTHHERWDGSGYPRGLQGDAIPLEGRIMAVVDAFDAMTHDRTHRRARSAAEAVRVIAEQRGRQFDPRVVDAFLRVHERGELITDSILEV